MSENADALQVHFLAAFQIVQGCLCVARQVTHGGLFIVSGGLPSSSFVVAQNGDSLFSKEIGKNQKRFVARNGFVAVCGPGTADKDGSGKGPRSLRDRQRGSKSGLAVAGR